VRPVRVGINGAGRIGRALWRVSLARAGISVVAVNDLMPSTVLGRLLARDSVYGALRVPVDHHPAGLTVGGVPVAVFHDPEPGRVPWGRLDVEVVLEATGRFVTAGQARRHLAAGAGRVVVSTASIDPDVYLFAGINDGDYCPRRHRLISPGCCTGMATAAVLAALRRRYQLRSCLITTVHAYDPTRSVLHDSVHPDRRMGRAATRNIVPAPVKPASALALEHVFPELGGRIAGSHLRVPVAIGCAAVLSVHVHRATTRIEVNETLAAGARLTLTAEPLVSTDITGVAQPCVVDGTYTRAIGDQIGVLAWFDNEYGFAHRLAETIELVAAGEPAVAAAKPGMRLGE
jgi:glyceraldehyde 3-phosphate dehydrogenase (phosphorylating)